MRRYYWRSVRYRMWSLLNLLLRPCVTGQHVGKTFVIDHVRIVNADLIRCTFLYGGSNGELVIKNVRMEDPTFGFFSNAANVLDFMHALEGANAEFIHRTFPRAFARCHFIYNSKENQHHEGTGPEQHT